MPEDGPGLHKIRTSADLGAALKKRLGMSARELSDRLTRQRVADRAARQRGHSARLLSETAGKTTIYDVFAGTKLPSMVLLVSLLRLVEMSEDERRLWIRKLDELQSVDSTAYIRVRQTEPLLLGVHKAISDLKNPRQLPTYVFRDSDNLLRERIQTFSGTGGFLLVLGDSSVGKTRSAYEAVLHLYVVGSPVVRG